MNQTKSSRLHSDRGLHVLDEGVGDDVIVLVHGLGSSHADWAAQIGELSKDHRVIAVDLRGHGGSPPARRGVTVDDLAEDVVVAVAGRHSGSFHIVGWSLGGLVATSIAANRPELVRSLVMVNSPPALRPTDLRERIEWAKRRVLTRCLSPRTLGTFISRRLFPEPRQ